MCPLGLHCFTIKNIVPKRDISFTKERKAADMLNVRMISSVPEDRDHHSLILIQGLTSYC